MAKGVKTGGRTKGTINKTTKEIREYYQTLVSNNIEQLDSDLKSLDSLSRLKMIIELSKFVIPTLKQQDFNIDGAPVINMISLGGGAKPQEILINDIDENLVELTAEEEEAGEEPSTFFDF